MKAGKSVALLCCAATLVLAGCMTTYTGPSGYVGHNGDGKLKHATQSSKLGEQEASLRNTYEDEYVYDAQGNVLKHKTTEYFAKESDTPQYVVWETEFKVVGGVALPSRVSANGVVYIEVDYQLLTSTNKGPVSGSVDNRRFSQTTYRPLSSPLNYYWKVNLENYPVHFEADDKFVETRTTFSPYSGVDTDNVMTLGYDNIVLKHYSFSYEKLAEGIKKSYNNPFEAFTFANVTSDLTGSSFSFDYSWDVKGNKICQTKMSFSRASENANVYFVANMAYDAAGQLTSEVWTAADSADAKKSKPVEIYRKSIEY